MEQATAHSNADRMRPIVGAQFVHEILDVEIHGSLRDGELTGDLLVTIAITNESEHLQFSARKIFIA